MRSRLLVAKQSPSPMPEQSGNVIYMLDQARFVKVDSPKPHSTDR